MKKQLSLLSAGFILSGATSTAQAVTLLLEDFEDTTLTYTQSHADGSDGSADYFGRVDSDGISITPQETFMNVQGTGFFAGQDIDASGTNDPNIQSAATLTWTGINVVGYTNLSFAMFVAEASTGNDWDTAESIIVSYRFDGAGAFTNIYGVESDADGSSRQAGIDRNNSGVAEEASGNGELVTNTFAQFTGAIAGTGSTIDLTITIADGGFTSGGEDFAFDDVLITGDAVPEPSSALLLAFGIFPLLRRKRS